MEYKYYDMSQKNLHTLTELFDYSTVAKNHMIVECMGCMEELIAELGILILYLADDTNHIHHVTDINDIIIELNKLARKPINTKISESLHKNMRIVITSSQCHDTNEMTKALLKRAAAITRRAERNLVALKVHHYDVDNSALACLNLLSKYLLALCSFTV